MIGPNRSAFSGWVSFSALCAGALCYAESGEAIYRAQCQSCHGTAGVPNPGIAKLVGVKPVTDPQVKDASEPEMVRDTQEGVGKMRPFQGRLSDPQIQAAVTYFRSWMK